MYSNGIDGHGETYDNHVSQFSRFQDCADFGKYDHNTFYYSQHDDIHHALQDHDNNHDGKRMSMIMSIRKQADNMNTDYN